MHPGKKLLFTAFVAVAGFIFSFLIATLLAISFFDVSIEDLSNLATPENASVLKFLQVAQAFGLFIFPPFIVLYFFVPSSIDYLKLNTAPKIIAVVLSVVTMISALPLINYLAEINNGIHLPEFMSGVEDWMREGEQNAAELTEILLEANTIWGLLLNIFIVAVLPAIGEELLFRGVIQQIIHEWSKNKHIAIWSSAILFSALHLQFLGFIPRMVMGAFFGYLFVWGKSLWFPIIAHFANNGFAVTALYYYRDKITERNMEELGAEGGGSTIVSFIIVSVALFLFYKMKDKAPLIINN